MTATVEVWAVRERAGGSQPCPSAGKWGLRGGSSWLWKEQGPITIGAVPSFPDLPALLLASEGTQGCRLLLFLPSQVLPLKKKWDLGQMGLAS